MSSSPEGFGPAYSGHVPILWRPFRQFAAQQTASGSVLIFSTLAALVWANSPWGGTYDSLWHVHLEIRAGDHALGFGLSHWINDGLMAIFFLLVGL